MKRVLHIIERGAAEGVFPGAVLLVAHRGDILFFECTGFRSLIPQRFPMMKDTVFDLASLTKPLATTLAIMKLVDQGGLDLDRPLAQLLPGAILKDKQDLTPRFLLSHSAGLSDWKPFYLKLVQFLPDMRKHLLREQIIDLPFSYPPGTRVLYSDLGFMLLEWVVEERAGEGVPAFLARTFYGPLGFDKMFMGAENRPLGVRVEDIAATEDCPWRRKVMRGEVHDENAYALGGYSGHAGLFGTAGEVYGIARMLRGHYREERQDFLRPETVRKFFRRQDRVEGSTWALGWDTPSPANSSAGRCFSRMSVGHLGFTGTSVWMDMEKDVIVILLTNRVHPTRSNEKIREFRPRLHDAVMEALKRI